MTDKINEGHIKAKKLTTADSKEPGNNESVNASDNCCLLPPNCTLHIEISMVRWLDGYVIYIDFPGAYFLRFRSLGPRLPGSQI